MNNVSYTSTEVKTAWTMHIILIAMTICPAGSPALITASDMIEELFSAAQMQTALLKD